LFNSAGGGDSLWCLVLGICFVVKPLALQVGEIDVIAINQPQFCHSGARQRFCLKAAQSAAADDANRRALNPLLSGFADRSEPDLPGIAILSTRSHSPMLTTA